MTHLQRVSKFRRRMRLHSKSYRKDRLEEFMLQELQAVEQAVRDEIVREEKLAQFCKKCGVEREKPNDAKTKTKEPPKKRRVDNFGTLKWYKSPDEQ